MVSPFDPLSGAVLSGTSPSDLDVYFNDIAGVIRNIGKGDTYTPTWTGITGGTASGYYVDLGLIVWFQAEYQWTTAPAMPTSLTVSLPTNVATALFGEAAGRFVGSDALPHIIHGEYSSSGGAGRATIKGVRASDGALVNINSAGPGALTLIDNQKIKLSGVYRKAA